MSREQYLIIADDFTGANDTGVQLCRRGYATEVVFAGEPISEGKSVVIDTESRTTTEADAYEIVKKAVSAVDFSKYAYVIKKIDSTMRGNIAREIQAVDEAFAPELIIFAPALPDLGRTTKDGVQHLNGVRICHTELAKDPENPVKEDHLVKVLQEVYQEPVGLISVEHIADGRVDFNQGRIFVCDAQSNLDLQEIIKEAKASNKKTLYIGTAGIANNIMEVESPSFPALAVVASVSSVTNGQMRFCEKKGYKLVELPIPQLITGQVKLEQFAREAIASIEAGKDTIVLTDTAYDRDRIKESIEAGKTVGMEVAQVSAQVQTMIGQISQAILTAAKVSGVFVTGGATALGLLKELRATGSQIKSEILPGIPLIKIKGGTCEGLKMVTKAGAFGAEDAVAFCLSKIKEKDEG